MQQIQIHPNHLQLPETKSSHQQISQIALDQISQFFTKSNSPPIKMIEFLTRSQLLNNNNTQDGSRLILKNFEQKKTTFQQIFQPNLFLSQQLSHTTTKNAIKNDANQSKENFKVIEQSETHLCLICYDNPPDSIFMECGHGGACYNCSLDLWKTTGECYLCRNKITQVLQIDLTYNNDQCFKILSTTKMVEEQVMQIVHPANV